MIAIETLAAAIRTSTDIKGIKLDLEEWKIVQYADDLTAFLSDLTSAQNLFKLLDRFGKLSGLKIYIQKQRQCGLVRVVTVPRYPYP